MRSALLLLCCSAPVIAGDRTVQLPLDHLQLEKGVVLRESSRGMGDTFPYLIVGREKITPKNLGKLLEGGVRSKEAAIEAVRLFVAGPLVKSPDTAARVIEAGHELAKTLKHLSVKVTDHRPASYEPTAKRAGNAWEVSLVGFEMDGLLQLVHVKATVADGGTVTIERHPIVSGPMTSWQTGSFGTPTSKEMQDAKEMRAEVPKARARYGKALQVKADLDTLWSATRVLWRIDELATLVRLPNRTNEGYVFDLGQEKITVAVAPVRRSTPHIRAIASAKRADGSFLRK